MRVMKPVDADEALWERNGLFWTEDNRLYSVIGEKVFSYYTYDDSGERRLKAHGSLTVDDKNADRYFYASFLDSLTLYPSPYLVVDGNGYTKHYYAGAERVCAKLGGGGFDGEETVLTYDATLSIISKKLFYGCMQQAESRSLPDNIPECITTDDGRDFVYNQKIDGLPQSVKIGVDMQPSSILYVVEKYGPVLRPEDEVYYYHSDHLGSASWISDYEGSAIQHLRYMPFGQPLRNERLSSYNERFTFSGKERDAETGLSYFGARYYDADLLTGWLSVDPMSDKYPSLSPYNYCAWNPVKLTDPDGRDGRIIVGERDGRKTITIQTTIYVKGGESWDATTDELNIIVDDMNFDANKYRKEKEIDDCIVSFDISFKAWTEDAVMQDGDNTMTLKNGKGRSETEGKRIIDAAGILVEQLSGNNANINSQDIYRTGLNRHVRSHVGMHETFHLLGLKDRYSGLNTSDKGYEKNIMGGNAGYHGNLSEEQYRAYTNIYSKKESGTYIQKSRIE